MKMRTCPREITRGQRAARWFNREDVEEDEDEEHGVRKDGEEVGPKGAKQRRKRRARKDPLAVSQLVPTLRDRARHRGRLPRRQVEVAEVHLNFMFKGDESKDKTLAVMVVRREAEVWCGAAEEQRPMAGQARHGVHERGWL